jgi:WD40 repeat protein
MHIFIQDGAKIYSLDKSKIIKIWDLHEQCLKQTYAGLRAIFPAEIPITVFYCPLSREYIATTKKIARIKCNPRVEAHKSDGITHIAPITLILLNDLYRFLVTTCTDSTIIVWDVWHGRKVNWILRAHTALRHGEMFPMEITAGTFDTRHQFLITGALDGSIRVWNFNEGF